MSDSEMDDYVVVTHSDLEEAMREPPAVVCDIKTWLAPTDFDSPTSEYHKHLNAHSPGTGGWILNTDQYRQWSESDTIGDLWIRGIPGSGKSVVAASLIHRLQQQRDTPVLFFFFRSIILSNKTPQSLVRDFCSVLVDHSSRLQSSLKLLMKEHPNVETVPFDDIWKCLSSSMARLPKVYCVVDALDEMEEGHDSFLQDLLHLGRQHPKSIKIIITSRQLPQLEKHLEGSSIVDLRLDRRNVDRDIATYIAHRLESAQFNFNQDEATIVEKTICDRGKGLFLYARLMMDQLLLHSENVVAHLDSLPDGLGNMYADILHEHAQRSHTTKEFQQLVLKWVTHSARPLRLLELAALVDSLPGRGGLDPNQDAKSAVKTTCGPLLELCEDGVIQIIHHSLTEFLTNPTMNHVHREGNDESFAMLDTRAVHAMMARTCLDYLTSGCFKEWTLKDKEKPRMSKNYPKEQTDLMQQFHFLQYAAQRWPFHASKAIDLDAETYARLDAFLQTDSHYFESWKYFWRGMFPHVPDGVSPLHVAAHSGLVGYTEHLLCNGADPNCVDGFGRTPLLYAAMEGQSKVVMVLLQHQANPNGKDYGGLASVYHATRGNHPATLRTLLAGGANPLVLKSKEDIGYQGAFHTSTDFLDISHLRSGPLHWAASSGKMGIVRALLQHEEVRNSINDKDVNGNTPLYLAARFRDSATVRTLLEHGASITVHSEEQGFKGKRYTPVHGWARMERLYHWIPRSRSRQEMKDVLQVLVDAGCNVNARDHNGQTALFASGRMDNESSGEDATYFISLLLHHGADASLVDFEGGTPLHQLGSVLVKYTDEAMRLLVDAGVDINAVSKKHKQTPLIAAAAGHNLQDPTFFQELKADFHLQDHHGKTALHYAVDDPSINPEQMLKWLSCTDPNVRNETGENALPYFMRNCCTPERLEMLALIVGKGMSLEARDKYGRTALLSLMASNWSYDHCLLIKELLKLGADAKVNDNMGKTGTDDHRDVEKKVEAMQDLINAGADIHAVDVNGHGVFHDAIRWKVEWQEAQKSADAVVQLGAPLGLRNYQGRTAVHMAAEMNEDNDEPCSGKASTRLDFVLQPQLELDIHGADSKGLTPLHLAALASERNAWRLIKAGADIQATARGCSALHIAAGAGQANTLGLLIERYKARPLPINGRNDTGQTPLHAASNCGRYECVKLLLDAGADVSVDDNTERTALHMAAQFERVSDPEKLVISSENDSKCIDEVIRLLLVAGADPGHVNCHRETPSEEALIRGLPDKLHIPKRSYAPHTLGGYLSFFTADNLQGLGGMLQTPEARMSFLKHAISAGHDVLVERLFRSKHLKLVEDNGKSILHFVVRWGLMPIMRRLIPFVEDFEVFSPPLLVTATERKLPNIEMIRLLIRWGIKRQGKGMQEWPAYSYSQAVHNLASGKHWWHSIALTDLLETGADPDVPNARYGETPFYCALETEFSMWCDRTVHILIKYGANVNDISSRSGTPLNEALLSKKDLSIIRRLLAYGASPSIGPIPAIFSAVSSLSTSAVELLLDEGVNPNVQSKTVGRSIDEDRLKTPLFLAACPNGYWIEDDGTDRNGQVAPREEIIAVLLARGADPLHPLEGSTVFHEICGMNGLVKPIIEAGVDIELRDSNGRTPLMRACDLSDRLERAMWKEYTALQLIQMGANIHAVDNFGSTALHYAIQSRLRKTTEELLRLSVSATKKNNDGLSPLHYAMDSPPQREEDMHATGWAIEALWNASADPLTRLADGRTALHCIAPCLMQCTSVCKGEGDEDKEVQQKLIHTRQLYHRLVEAGCDSESRDNHGNTPLFAYVSTVKVRSGEYALLHPPDVEDHRKILTENDIHAVNHNGDTLLHAISQRTSWETDEGGLDLFKLVVELGVSPRKENKEGVTALDVAAACGKDDILALFSRDNH
ncbi:hypothetical protein MW887_011534 [Aspergillus wentii]|nr:hypothetical protein MW887_011534 [Aspergillus wentii]